jgi:phosphoribosylanthranilate isomerase
MGFAGGLGPDNIAELARYVTESMGDSDGPTWLDMESGVRTDDRLDLAKVRAVLEICSKTITPGK